MAFKIFIAVSLIAMVHAGFVWVDDDDDSSGFHKIPEFYIPKPPRIRLPNFGFIPFSFPMPKIPDVQDIRNARPGPDQVYSGVAIRSSSGVTKDKDGNIVKTGGTSLLVNNDGKVQEAEFGRNPPNLDDPIVIPPIPSIHHHDFHHFAPIPPIPPIPPIAPIPPIPPMAPIPPIPVDHKPGKNEHFVSVSTSSFSHSSNIDGVKSASAGKDTIVNVDGNVDEETVQYGEHDKAKTD